MRKHTSLAALAFCMLGGVQAQDPASNRELLLRLLENVPTPAEVEAADRREARYRERVFVQKANRVAQLWTKFALQYNDRRAVDIKTAHELAKAFEALQHDDGWPNRNR